MENPNLSAFTILSPDIVQYRFTYFKILYFFERDERGQVTGVEVYKRQPMTGKTIWGRYSETNHPSTFYSMVRLEAGLFRGERVEDFDVNWATRALYFEHLLDKKFEEFENSLKNLRENLCI